MEVGATHQESFQINVDENDDDDGAVKCILESPKVLRGKSKQTTSNAHRVVLLSMFCKR